MNNPESQESHELSDSPNQWSSLAEEPSFEEHISDTEKTSHFEFSEDGYDKNKDYYRGEDGNIYRNIDRIDITTDQGKYEWLSALYQNHRQTKEYELEQAINDEDEESIDYIKRELDEIKRAEKILLDEINPDDSDVFSQVIHSRDNAAKEWIKITDAENVSDKIKGYADTKLRVANNMISVLDDEISRRDPDYFNAQIIESRIEQNIKQVEKTMADGYSGKHLVDEAKQDSGVFEQLWAEYCRINDYNNGRATPKSEFRSLINKYIEDHEDEIEEINLKTKSLEKGTSEYNELISKRRALAEQRRSAQRLLTNYFV